MVLKINDYVGTLSKIENLTSHTRLFTIDLDKEIEFKSGQFVNLAFELNGEMYRRPYSIASSPSNKNQIQLCINLVENGKFTPKLFEKKEGDKVMLKGPLGLFTLKDETQSSPKIAFICTGTGIAPLRSMLKSIFEKQEEQNTTIDEEEGIIENYELTLIFGTRTEDSIILEKEFKEYQNKYPNFKYYIVLSQSSENWEGRKGYVQNNFDMIDPLNTDVYICGVPKMIESVNEKLLEMGMTQEKIHFEKFN